MGTLLAFALSVCGGQMEADMARLEAEAAKAIADTARADAAATRPVCQDPVWLLLGDGETGRSNIDWAQGGIAVLDGDDDYDVGDWDAAEAHYTAAAARYLEAEDHSRLAEVYYWAGYQP